MPRLRPLAAGLLALSLAAHHPAVVWAEDAKPEKQEPRKPETAQAFDAQRSVTRHTLALPSGPLAYTVTAEFLPLREVGKDEAAARIFTVTYTLEGADNARRPVIFLFNGGPGAASAYLHLGTAGPRMVAFNPDGTMMRPPAALADNPDTWLTFADLVFIDPVGAGYSRVIKGDGDAEKRFWKIDADARYLSEIVRLWLVRQGRWESPKFLAGESYGGFRIAKMARELLRTDGIALNGLVMVSPVIDFGTIRDGDTALLASAFKLPGMAAAAAAHGLAQGTQSDAAAAAERFALTGYLSGLATLDVGRLAASQDLFAEVARLTGLPPELVARHRGRVPARVFARELLRDRGLVVSTYDGVFTGLDPAPSSPRTGEDPYLIGTLPAYSSAFTGYAQRELGVTVETPYRLLSETVNRGWEWPRDGSPSALDDLQTVMTLTPGLRLLVAHGRTDLVTPYLASHWVAARLELPEAERARIALPVYDGGHMMYANAASRAALARDVRAMVEAALR
ncbi:MAG TPA: septum formation initiator [Azospirillum sp.]|nr:septum formation initiator [Azospirillum sp.]